MKQTIVSLLRKTGLLPLAERARYLAGIPKTARMNKAFLSEHPGFVLPPSFLMYDAYGGVNYQTYFSKGTRAAGHIAQIVSQYLGNANPVSLCDWGCGPARIVRHLPPLLPPGSHVFGTDYNAKSIEWCASHLDGVTFKLNGLTPPLPFSTGQLDFLYAVSVLTHLSEEMHCTWLDECKRVVRSGGLLLLTVHGDRASAGLLQSERALYDAGKLVVRGRVLEGSRAFVAFQSPRFMRETLLRGLDILLHNPPDTPAIAGSQDVYVVRNL